MSLKQFEANVQSQFGEDGVIEEVFKRIGTKNNICIEFGAWDGVHLSNTWKLWHNENWNALLIEGITERFNALTETTKEFKNVQSLNAFVTLSGYNSLNAIFDRLQFPSDIDLLCIDIDGDDFYIFESLENYRPRLVIVEYNPSIPPHLEIVQEPGQYFGCSALALFKLAKVKDYKLVHMTDTNMFFVRTEDHYKMNLDESELYTIFPVKYLTNVMTNYGGKAFVNRVPVYMKNLEKNKIKMKATQSIQQKSKVETLRISPEDLISISIFENK